MTVTTLLAAADRALAFRHLAAADRSLAKALEALGEPPWRAREGGYAGLARIIAFQQLSTKAAAAIWDRVEAAFGPAAAATHAAADVEALRACGLSRPKIAHLKSVAAAELGGALDFTALRGQPDSDAQKTLVAVKGVGPWTARLYLMFCEGRADLIPDNDIGLLEALKLLDGAENRLSFTEFAARAERWRPYRTAAAMLLWGYVNALRERPADPG